MPITLCVPKVSQKYTYQEVYNIFSQYNFGRIEYINIVPNAIKSWKIYIKYYYWFYNEKNNRIKKILSEDKGHFKIIVEEPDYWKCFIAKSAKQ